MKLSRSWLGIAVATAAVAVVIASMHVAGPIRNAATSCIGFGFQPGFGYGYGYDNQYG